MKTPFSPSLLLESGQIFAFGGMTQELMDTPTPSTLTLPVQQTPSPGQGGAYSLCEVCNLQLTSTAQAQLHYNGRSHLRRVKQLQAGEARQRAAAGVQTRSLPPATGFTSQPAGLTQTTGQNRALSASNTTAGNVSGAVGGALPGLIGATGSSVMMKPFLPFPMETTAPVGLFPNFNTMDPVQKAVINHTFGVTMVPKKKQVISCTVCQLRFNSDSQAEAHYRGSRHAKKLKSQENKAKAKLSVTPETNGNSCGPARPAQPLSTNSSNSQGTELFSSPTDSLSSLKPCLPSSPSISRAGSEPPASSPPSALPAPGLSSSSSSSSSSKSCPPSSVTPSPSCAAPRALQTTSSSSQDAPLSAEAEEEKAKKLLYCSLCKVAVNSLSQLEAHNAGSKHKTMLEARSGAGPIKAYPRPGAKLKNGSTATLKGSGLQNKTFHCQICDVHVNSEIQLKQHISSRRHKDRVAGKPSKPKYSPYNKQQRSSLTELVKPSLSPSFLSSPFTSPSSPLPPSISLPPSSFSSSPLPPSISLPRSSFSSSPLPPPISLPPSTFSSSPLPPSISLPRSSFSSSPLPPSISLPPSTFSSSPLPPSISLPPSTFSSSPLPPSISLSPSSFSSSPLFSHTSSPITPTISHHYRPPSSSSLFTASFLRRAPGPVRTNQGSILFSPY